MYREAASASSTWLNQNLWTGLVRHYGPVWTVLLGSPEEIAAAFLEYKQIGVTDFIISGWPEIDEVDRFGTKVLPLVRDKE
jgi:alkanesulfonate monooxygenase